MAMAMAMALDAAGAWARSGSSTSPAQPSVRPITTSPAESRSAFVRQARQNSAAQPYTGLAGIPSHAVRRCDGAPCGKQFLDRERVSSSAAATSTTARPDCATCASAICLMPGTTRRRPRSSPIPPCSPDRVVSRPWPAPGVGHRPGRLVSGGVDVKVAPCRHPVVYRSVGHQSEPSSTRRAILRGPLTGIFITERVGHQSTETEDRICIRSCASRNPLPPAPDDSALHGGRPTSLLPECPGGCNSPPTPCR